MKNTNVENIYETALLTLELPIVNRKLFLPRPVKMTGKKYVIIEYFYIYWFITFLQKQFHVTYIFGIINSSGTMIHKRWLTHL